MAPNRGEFEVSFELKERAMDEAPVGITISDPGREDNPLVYVNEAFERMTGVGREEAIGRNCRFLQGEESDPDAVAAMREAIEEEEPVTVELINYRADGEPFWNEVTIAPLRDEEGSVTNFVGFQSDVTARKEAEIELARRTEELEHLVSRINGLLQDVTGMLMRTESREETEREVCERIVAADPYVFAWFGEPDRARDAIVPSSWAGAGESLDEIEIDLDGDDPTAMAFETGAVQTSGEFETTGYAHLVSGARSVAAAPLTYRDRTYGVLTVCADEPDAFEGREVVVIEALGRTIAMAINAAESRRILTTDAIVELVVETRDRDLFFVDLSARCGCDLEYEGATYGEGDALSMFFWTDGSPTEVVEAARETAGIEGATVTSEGADGGLVEFRVGHGSVVAELAGRGAKTEDIAAEDGVARLRIELPAESDAREVVERIRERYPDAELVSYRERERPPVTKGEFIAEVEERLTDRQLAALQRAFLSGYYDPNRRTSGDELAESMDISRSTFHQHLRAAERKLIGEFLDR